MRLFVTEVYDETGRIMAYSSGKFVFPIENVVLLDSKEHGVAYINHLLIENPNIEDPRFIELDDTGTSYATLVSSDMYDEIAGVR